MDIQSNVKKNYETKGIKISYEGETCRNAHIRGNEHMKALERKDDKSALYKHILSDHREEKQQVQFQMKVVGRFKTAISRQIDEGVRIQNKNSKFLLNSKTEFYGPAIKRKILEGKSEESLKTKT